jgi:hypothetical protein
VSRGVHDANMLAMRRSMCDLLMAVRWQSDDPIRLLLVCVRHNLSRHGSDFRWPEWRDCTHGPYPHARHDHADQHAYCLAHIVPLWERWTDGNLAARRLLECTSVDPDSHEERFQMMMTTTRELCTRRASPSIEAALLAAAACVNAYSGVPTERFAMAWHRALDVDAVVRRAHQ